MQRTAAVTPAPTTHLGVRPDGAHARVDLVHTPLHVMQCLVGRHGHVAQRLQALRTRECV